MKTENKTKIVATIGPATDSLSKMKELLLAGVDVFRFNTKHATVEWHNEKIKIAQKAALLTKKRVGIMIDLQGGEVRVETREGKELMLRKKENLFIGHSWCCQRAMITITDAYFFKKLKIGDNFLINDGEIELVVVKKEVDLITAEILDGGLLKNRASANFPSLKKNISSLIKRDLAHLDAAAKNNITFVALSFISSAEEIKILKKEMEKRKIKALTVAKIENQSAIDNIDEIIESADNVMIARGDLGIEVPIEQLAFWQKEIIKKCRKRRKPVIVATQMLYSMTNNPRPTRAEAIDVANAVLDGTDAVLLSEETAIGQYPLKSVLEIARILEFNEKNAHFEEMEGVLFSSAEFVIGAIAKKMEKKDILVKLKIKKAIVFTESGYTARILSAFRPKIRIEAFTNNKETAETLSLSYGVNTHYRQIDFQGKTLEEIVGSLKKVKFLSKGEVVAVFHGRSEKNPDLLNLFSLIKI